MIVTTGHSIEGYEIVEYLEMLSAEYALQTTYLKGFFSKEAFNVMNAAGYYDKSNKGFLSQHIPTVLKGLRHQAESIGANGVISVSFQVSTLTNDFVILLGTGTAVKIRKESGPTKPNNLSSSTYITDDQKNNSIHQSEEQSDARQSVMHSGDSIQILKFLVENIEQFKNTQEIKSYYLKSVKSEDVDESLVKIMDKRIALERMFGSMKYDTKKDIEKILGS